MQLYGVGDAGLVWQASQVLPGEQRSATGGSFGVGMRVGLPMKVTASLEVDQPLGRDVGQEDNRNTRVFFSLNKAF